MPRPRLLISVRNAAEAGDALDAGAELIDVKEPARGALGMADGETIREVIAAVNGRAPTSIALGELVDGHALPALDRWPAFAKFGLAGAALLSDWRERFASALALLPRDVQAVAVAYADWRTADAPAPREVLRAASDLNCRGVLVDTCDKTRGSLLSQLSLDELRSFLEGARHQGLLTVIAGGLRMADLELLAALEPDYFGFRGAACRGDRSATLDPARVRTLRGFLEEAAASTSRVACAMPRVAAG